MVQHIQHIVYMTLISFCAHWTSISVACVFANLKFLQGEANIFQVDAHNLINLWVYRVYS